MREYIERHNIAIYENRLRIEINPAKRKFLLRQLANENTKLKTTLFNSRESKRLFELGNKHREAVSVGGTGTVVGC